MENTNPVIFLIPSEKDVASLKPGDRAIDPFGRWAEVTEISFRGTDTRGFQYVGYCTKTGPTSSVSGGYKVNRLVRHAGIRHTSSETDAIEAKMRDLKLGLITVEPGLTIEKVFEVAARR